MDLSRLTVRTWEIPSPKKPKSRLTRGSKIRPVSAKRIKLNKIYSALRKKFLEDHPWDQVVIAQLGYTEDQVTGGNGVLQFPPDYKLVHFPRSEDIHHRKGRGKYFLDTTTWYAVSRKTHEWIHANPKESYEKGWMLPRN